MTLSVVGTLFCYMIINSFTPGPGNILAMTTTSSLGWKKGKKLIFGICCGYFFVQFFCTIALYSLSMLVTPVLSILKYIGTCYMVWLSMKIALSNPTQKNEDKMPYFSTGFLLQFVNVKIYFYVITLLTVYFIPYLDSLSLIILAGIGAATIGSIASLTWAFLGIKLQSKYEKNYRFINSLLALFLLYCAWVVAFQ